MTFSKFQQTIMDAIEKRVTNIKCPICKNNNFAVLDGYTRRFLNKDLNKVQIGSQNLPSATVICHSCGYIMDFSIGALGLMNNLEGSNNGKKKK
jgi:hypothetical protein